VVRNAEGLRRAYLSERPLDIHCASARRPGYAPHQDRALWHLHRRPSAEAREIIRVARERDPQCEKRERREAITVAEVCDAYLEAARQGRVVTRFRQPKKLTIVAVDDGGASLPSITSKPSNIVRSMPWRFSASSNISPQRTMTNAIPLLF